jgi:hypothetical protein
VEAHLEKAKANPEEMKASLEIMEVIAVHQSVPNEEAKLELSEHRRTNMGTGI